MKKFRFQISNCIDVEVEAETVEEARMDLVVNTMEYADEMLGGSCCISDGEEVALKEFKRVLQNGKGKH